MRQLPLTVLILLITTLAGCGGDSDNDNDGDHPPPSELPLLSSDNHLSFYPGFNAVQPEATSEAMELRWQEAINHGMDVGRIQLDWSELEPQPNQYDKDLLEQQLIEMKQDGLQPFVLLSTIDSEGYTLPDDLEDEDSDTFLANGMQFDDHIILNRFNSLLDWVVPMVIQHGGWVLAVGNEPGNLLTDYPEFEDNMVNFLISARKHAHSIDDRLAITMTVAYFNMELGYSFHQSMLQHSDVASFNYYAADTDILFDDDATNINHEIDIMLDAAGSKQLIFQELGASAGYEDRSSLMGASLQGQSQFFDTFLSRMQAEERIRVAVTFQLVDWDPDLVDSLYSTLFYEAGLPEDFILRFAESLETTGLIRYEDGSTRPAWDTVLDYIKSFSTQ